MKLKALKTIQELRLLGKKLAVILQLSHELFADQLNEILDLFLTNSPTNCKKLVNRWLYSFYECFCAAFERKLWVKAGLLLCAIVTIEGASSDLARQRLILYRNEELSDELSTAAKDEFGSAFLHTAVCYTNSRKYI